MAKDIMHVSAPAIRPGDSLVVSVSELSVGLGADITGQAAVYIHVKCTDPVKSGLMLVDDQSRYPVMGTMGGWTQIRMDTVYSDSAHQYPLPGTYCVDLNDNFFTPPDRIDYYFSARDAIGNTSYWSQNTGMTASEAEVQANPMEVQCLPTGNSDILYVDDFHTRGSWYHFKTAFEFLNITPDRYDVNGPSSLVGNSLGARAVGSQIVDVYHKIIWNSGDLPNGTIGDGTGHPEKSPDAQLLKAFLDNSSIWDPGLYISGDNVAQEMMELSSAPFMDLMTYFNFNLTGSSHIREGEPISPLVCGLMPNTMFQDINGPDTLVAHGGCPHTNHFDVLEPTGPAISQMTYSGAPDPMLSAVISQETTNLHGRTARVVLEGFSFHYIRDDRPAGVPDRAMHLYRIMTWLENIVDYPVGGSFELTVKNELRQNYPNPFNPRTTIEYSIKGNGYVSVKIYNVAGQLVKTLVNEIKNRGSYKVQWDGRNDSGDPVSTGVYFYKLVAKDFTQTRKLVVLK
jgi:hypothetical protein